MIIRNATMDDFSEILAVYEAARAFMRASGNPSQWGTTAPAPSLLMEDIQLNRLYVLVQEEQAASDNSSVTSYICAAFAFYQGPDPCYASIEDGKWPNDEPYHVAHRIASNGKVHGCLRMILDYCESHSQRLRIDTHEDNKVMQHLLDKYAFTRCGIVYMEDNTKRIAYQSKA